MSQHQHHLYVDGRGRPGSMRSVSTASTSAGRRPPPALRGAASRSLRAHAHVTLVFATGDQLPPSASVPQGLRRCVSGASPVEEALSRQLDRDTAGQHLGLRSRRSSAATLASMRTDYTSNHNLSPPSEEEEPQTVRDKSRRGTERQPDAEPSRAGSNSSPLQLPPAPPPCTPSGLETPPPRTGGAACATPSLGTTPQGTPQRRSSLNPKTSSAWLRWSSPAPTFPKKDKGKAKEEPAETVEATVSTRTVSGSALQAQVEPSSSAAVAAITTSSSSAVPPPTQPTQPPPRSTHTSNPTVADPATINPTNAPSHTAPPTSTSNGSPHTNTKATSKSSHSPLPVPTPTPAKPKTLALNASTSSTVRSSDEADVSRMLDSSVLRENTKTMDSSSGNTADAANKPDPSLELPPPQPPASVRGWRIPFWGSSAPTESASTAPRPSEQQPKNDDTPTASAISDTSKSQPKDATPSPADAPQPPDTADVSKPETRSGKGSAANGRDSVMTNGSAQSSKRRKIDEGGARLSAPVSEPAKASPQATTETTTTTTAPAPQPTSETTAATEEASTKEKSKPDADTQASANDRALASAQQQPMGWGSYLASFVYKTETPVTPTAPTFKEGEGQASEATDVAQPEAAPGPAPEQPARPPPILAPPIALDQPISTALTSASQPPKPQAPENAPAQSDTPSSSPAQAKLASSTSSAGGWLSYLAFRASQKKITGSTVSVDGKDDATREEVMDFSADPEFPSAEAPPSTPPRAAAGGPAPKTDTKDTKGGKGKDKAVAPEKDGKPASTKDSKIDAKDTAVSPEAKGQPANKTVVQKKSQNLALATRRQSNASSVRSAGTAVPLSPRAQAAAKAGSALPAPPVAKQPNLVIPNFETTFDRPPRSLMPRTAQDGVTATAWRALSYVVGSANKDPEGETRGLKEGRDVGAGLPRRIGLGGVGTRDDGWKNVHRVVVIGVHGWFPAKLLNSVIGEPTGTSQKFANMMGEAVKQFFREKGVDESEIRLTLIPLEGEGVIDDRVDKLYKAYLSNPAWINDVRRADAILFAAHSQGCIVTTHLISRMIAQGHIRTAQNRDAVARCEWAFGPIAIIPSEDSKRGRKLAAGLSGAEGGYQKVVMLAMCGVHLGPFLSISTSSVIGPYLTWFENAAARELFEFQDTESPVSQAYQRSLAMILDNEVRVLLLASLNDQVVPIYGASFSAATHPLLLRALFVDGASYSASDFMTNLICFAFMLRNAGIDDQRLVEHLSEATAGSLTGVGHSSPYEELGCYSLAVHYLFHTGPAAQPLPPLQVESFAARDARNDFELPWIMRALVDSPEVKDLFPDELRDLKASITAWKPATKPLKEIKRRLEPMAGRPARNRTTPGPSALGDKRNSHLASHSSSTSLASMSATPEQPSKKQQTSRLASGASGWAESQAYGTRR